jgi:hypothetical protein
MHSHPQLTLPLILTLWFTLIALVLYVQTLVRALKKCAVASRTITPGRIWLVLIPVFGLEWQFVVVTNIAKSLRNEFSTREIACPDPKPGRTLGLAMCVCNCCVIIPGIAHLAGVIGVALWIVYWIRIANYSRLLDAPQTISLESP